MTYAEQLGWEAVVLGDDPLTLEDLVPTRDWQRDALCREPEYADVNFFIDQGGNSKPAKDVCSRCLARERCLAEALTVPAAADFGIWGGTSAQERRRLRARQGLADAA